MIVGPKRTALPLKIGTTGCPDTPVTTIQRCVTSQDLKETAVYNETRMKHAAHCMGKTAEFIYNVEVGGRYSYGGALSV